MKGTRDAGFGVPKRAKVTVFSLATSTKGVKGRNTAKQRSYKKANTELPKPPNNFSSDLDLQARTYKVLLL